ncbi:MAG TPA: cupin domain-containing protein [Steroidobacteraceae bacterium]|nr:cupin domain-containing protein [Steroidobacteraceae bacterium]
MKPAQKPRRVVTGHDARGKSVVLSDGTPPQRHAMHGPEVGADFFEIWNSPQSVPVLSSTEAREPSEREFTIMPTSGHLLRIIEVYPPQAGGKRTVMHRTKTLDYMVVIEGEIVLVLDDSEVLLKQGDVVVQRGTDHAWENRADRVARLAFFHIDAEFSPELLAKLPKPLQLMR